jgi:hypothetical protein
MVHASVSWRASFFRVIDRNSLPELCGKDALLAYTQIEDDEARRRAGRSLSDGVSRQQLRQPRKQVSKREMRTANAPLSFPIVKRLKVSEEIRDLRLGEEAQSKHFCGRNSVHDLVEGLLRSLTGYPAQ